MNKKVNAVAQASFLVVLYACCALWEATFYFIWLRQCKYDGKYESYPDGTKYSFKVEMHS